MRKNRRCTSAGSGGAAVQHLFQVFHLFQPAEHGEDIARLQLMTAARHDDIALPLDGNEVDVGRQGKILHLAVAAGILLVEDKFDKTGTL